MMKNDSEQIIAEIILDGCPEGAVLQPLEYQDEIRDRYFIHTSRHYYQFGIEGSYAMLLMVKCMLSDQRRDNEPTRT
jgi:hypothetical protein